MNSKFPKIEQWFTNKNWTPFKYQRQVWQAYLDGKSGLLNAPTGSGKTYALYLALLADWLKDNKDPHSLHKPGLRLLWITPLRALAKDLERAMKEVTQDLGIPWDIQRRTGDISQKLKKQQRKQMPEVLITTPESVHIILAQEDYPRHFKHLDMIVVDEWHELLGSKRGILVELGLSRLKSMKPNVSIWGISATIGNLEQAAEVLLGADYDPTNTTLIRASLSKQITSHTILPDDIEKLPWAGHIGIRLLPQVVPVIENSRSTLIFTNTRSQAEIWFQNLLDIMPELAGQIALHHGSLDRSIRNWVEKSLHEGSLKAVVCTSSLDLGVDFSPVETVIQIGSPKGVARYLQRAGRSGHQPGAESTIYFVPTHALEIIEGAALQSAKDRALIEDREPILKPFDVLSQYLVTLAVSDGFKPDEIWQEVTATFAYQTLTKKEWRWILRFISSGGESLSRYRDFTKVTVEDGVYNVINKRIASRHRMSIGTIASDSTMRVRYLKGSTLGTIEEYFIAGLKTGDYFWFAGRNLELVKVKGMTAYVRRASNNKESIVPSWLGGRMSLSSNLSEILREKLYESTGNSTPGLQRELKRIAPLIEQQMDRSHLPSSNELLIEKTTSREGTHLYIYPFEGRYVHEGMAALVAWRLAQIKPISFSIAMNDYGFELLSDKDIPIEEAVESDLFSDKRLVEDIFSSLNDTELAKRRFRQISQVAGLVFPGYPGQNRTNKHLQMSSGLLFDVFMQYEPDHLLLQQAYDEVLRYQLDESRLRKVLQRIRDQKIILKYPERFTPLCFPIMADRLRERLSSEKLADRIMHIQSEYTK